MHAYANIWLWAILVNCKLCVHIYVYIHIRLLYCDVQTFQEWKRVKLETLGFILLTPSCQKWKLTMEKVYIQSAHLKTKTEKNWTWEGAFYYCEWVKITSSWLFFITFFYFKRPTVNVS